MYHAARAMGFHIIGSDKNPQAICRGLSDQFLNVSSRLQDKLLTVLGNEVLDAIVSPASDYGIMTAYNLGIYYGLGFGNSLLAAKSSTDKKFFNELMGKHGVRTPKCIKVVERSDLKKSAEKIGYPLVLKPTDAAGGKGITYIDDEAELNAAFEKAMKFSASREAVVESYIEGVHYSSEWFRCGGKTVFGATSMKVSDGSPSFLTIQHMIPAPFDEDTERDVRETLDRVCDICGVDNGPVNVDFIISEAGIYVIEMSARISGNGFSNLIKESYGIDNCMLSLQIAMGQPLFELENARFKANSALKVITSDSDGKFSEVSGLSKIKKHPAFIEECIFVKPGDMVRTYTNESHKLGYVIMAHPDLTVLKAGIKLVDTVLKIEYISDAL